jgi:hypothetical protein
MSPSATKAFGGKLSFDQVLAKKEILKAQASDELVRVRLIGANDDHRAGGQLEQGVSDTSEQ